MRHPKVKAPKHLPVDLAALDERVFVLQCRADEADRERFYQAVEAERKRRALVLAGVYLFALALGFKLGRDSGVWG